MWGIPGLGRFSEHVTVVEISVCHAQRNTKPTARREFSLFREVHWIQTELGYCSALSLPCPNHSGRQLKPLRWVSNVGLIISTTL